MNTKHKVTVKTGGIYAPASQTASGLSSCAVVKGSVTQILNLELAAVSLRFHQKLVRSFLSEVKSCLYGPCTYIS